MKKLISIAIVLGLCGSAALYLSSCAQIEGPLGPGGGYSVTQIDGSQMPEVDFMASTEPANVSTTAQLVFTVPLDPATVNANTVMVYTQDDSGVTETQYNNVTISYNAAAQAIVFAPSNGLWDDNKHYRIQLTTGIRSTGGAQLDGNGNKVAESSVFDNLSLPVTGMTITFGAPTAPGYTPMQKGVQVMSVAWATNSDNGTGDSSDDFSNISANYSNVTITVRFNTSDVTPSDFVMDPATFYHSANQLHDNVVFTDTNGNNVTPLSTVLSTTAWPNDTLTMVFAMQPSSKYYLQLKGGINGIQSANEATMVISRHFYFDGNDNDVAEASDDTRKMVFSTQDSNGNDLPIVRVTSSSWDSTNRRIIVNFTVPTGIGTLDPASITTWNFITTNTSNDITFLPSALVLDNSTFPAPVVYVYLPLRFHTNSSTETKNVRIIVRRDVQSSDGISMDQDSNGILMENGDDYSNSFSGITSYAPATGP